MRVPSLLGLAAVAASVALGACSDTNSLTSVAAPADLSASVVATGAVLSTNTAGTISNIAASYSMAPGDTLQLMPVLRDSTGVLRQSTNVHYASSNAAVASVSVDGLVKAVTAGTAVVTVSREHMAPFSTKVTVAVPAPIVKTTVAPIAPATGAVYGPQYSHQPAGFSLIADRPFSTKAADQYDRANSEGWDPIEGRYPNLTLVDDPTAPQSGGSVMQMYYPVGMGVCGCSPAIAQKWISAPVHELYFSLWIQLSPNFLGSTNSTNKMFFFWINNQARFFLSAEGAGTGTLRPQVRLQGVPDARYHIPANIDPTAQIVRGQWQHWEVVVKSSTAGKADGTVQWYIDGKLVTDIRDLALIDVGESNTWNQLQWAPVWGGTNNSSPGMWIRWDHAYLSGR